MATIERNVVVNYDPAEDRYQASYNLEKVSPTLAVVEAIAAIEGSEPLQIEPLGTTVDLDALNSVLRSGTGQSEPTVTLRLRGYEIVLYSTGRLVLQQMDSEPGDGVQQNNNFTGEDG